MSNPALSISDGTFEIPISTKALFAAALLCCTCIFVSGFRCLQLIPPLFFSFYTKATLPCTPWGEPPCSSFRRRGFIRGRECSALLVTVTTTKRPGHVSLAFAWLSGWIAPSHASSPRPPVDLARGHGPLLSAWIALRRPSLSLSLSLSDEMTPALVDGIGNEIYRRGPCSRGKPAAGAGLRGEGVSRVDCCMQRAP